MSFSACHNALCWALSALMLAGTGISTAYGHSHAGGEVAHEHESHFHVGCGHCENHDHDHVGDSMPSPVAATASDALHAHVTWFGITLHVPHPAVPDDQEAEFPFAGEMVFSPLTQPFNVNVDGHRAVDHFSLTAIPFKQLDFDSIKRDILLSPAVTSSSLCDAARRERTGVLRC